MTDQAFREQQSGRDLLSARLAALLVMVLVPAGVSLDFFTHPEAVGPFFALRLLAGAVSGLLYAATFHPRAVRYARILGVAPAMVAVVAILLLMLQLEGHGSPYYAGLNLCILGVGLVFTWRWQQTAWLCAVILGLWLLLPLFSPAPFALSPFFNNLFFLSLTSVIAVAANAARYKAARREFDARAQLTSTTAALAASLEQVKQLDQAKTEFFTNVSHELRTPLTLILAPLESLLSRGEAVSADVQAELQRMRRNGRRLLRTINALLDLSRLDAGRERLSLEQVDLVELFEGMVDGSRGLALQRQVTLEFIGPQAPLSGPVDRDKLEKIFLNLLSNALRFSGGESPGRVRVRLGQAQERLYFEVQDDGIGIPAEQHSRVFERFHQVEEDSESRGGTGIGLALVKELTEFHLGTLSLQSEPKRGSTFRVEWPAALSAYPAQRLDPRPLRTARERRTLEVPSGLPSSAGLRAESSPPDALAHALRPLVLVADDNPDLRDYLSGLLSQEYRVVLAEDGEAALERTRFEVPSLVISDMMMPRKDGPQLLAALRGEPRTCRVPVILVTAKADPDAKVGQLELGADDYLTKPFDPRELLVRVRTLITQRRLERELSEKNEYLGRLNLDLVLAKKQVFLDAMEAFAAAVEAKDTYTSGHSRRVAMLSEQLARGMALSDAEVEKIRIAAILHDVGKIGMPEMLLAKPGKLTPEELEVFRKHPTVGYSILAGVRELQEISRSILHHHERYDGSGYPAGLAGEAIPLPSRLLAVCDTYDAMTSDRPYRKGCPHEVAISEIARCSGSQFDPACVQGFLLQFELSAPLFPEFPSALTRHGSAAKA